MPKVKYTYQDEGDPSSRFSECDVLPPGMNIELRGKQMVMLWNEEIDKANQTAREDEKQNLRELVSVEVVDLFLHEHVWIITISRRQTGGREWLQCQHCKVEATRHNDGPAQLTERWQSETGYHEHCHEKKPVLKRPTFK